MFVRRTAKTYGTCRLAEGGEVAGRRIAVIEDVVSTGGQVIDLRTLFTMSQLRESRVTDPARP